MVEDLIEQRSKLHLANDEGDDIDLGDGFEEEQYEKLSLRLVGQIVTENPLNF